MFKNHKIGRYFGAIALGLTFVNLNSAVLNAQDKTSEYRFLQNIEAGTDANWSFSSKDELISVKDDIEKLEEYSISESDSDADVQLIKDNRRWGNRGDARDYSIEAEFYDY